MSDAKSAAITGISTVSVALRTFWESPSRLRIPRVISPTSSPRLSQSTRRFRTVGFRSGISAAGCTLNSREDGAGQTTDKDPRNARPGPGERPSPQPPKEIVKRTPLVYPEPWDHGGCTTGGLKVDVYLFSVRRDFERQRVIDASNTGLGRCRLQDVAPDVSGAERPIRSDFELCTDSAQSDDRLPLDRFQRRADECSISVGCVGLQNSLRYGPVGGSHCRYGCHQRRDQPQTQDGNNTFLPFIFSPNLLDLRIHSSLGVLFDFRDATVLTSEPTGGVVDSIIGIFGGEHW